MNRLQPKRTARLSFLLLICAALFAFVPATLAQDTSHPVTLADWGARMPVLLLISIIVGAVTVFFGWLAVNRARSNPSA